VAVAKNKPAGPGKIFGVFALAILFWVVIVQFSSGPSEQEKAAAKAEAARVAAMTPEQRAAEDKAKAERAAKVAKEKLARERKALGLDWAYYEDTDAVSGKQVKRAIVRSSNTVNFDFPYSGAQRAQLTLRKHPRYKTDAILSIERGQFVCSVSGCQVSVRFGAKGVVRYDVNEPADHSSTSLFISNYSAFVSNLRKADKVVIGATFHQEGDRAFEFDVSDLNWR